MSPTYLPFSVVAKPTGAACNLDCEYCFFLSKELLYDKARQEMSLEVAHTYVDRFLEASPDGEVTMLWQGGEPTLRGIDFFRDVLDYADRQARPTQMVTHAIQTNGTLITDEWARLLADRDVLVGVSIDGPKHCHDAYRVNRAARGTYDQVVRGWERLQARDVRCNILCTVHHANEDHPEDVYRHFRDELGATFLQFIPIVERVPHTLLATAEQGWGRTRTGERPQLLYQQAGSAVTSRSVTPTGYGRFLSRIFDLWVASDVGEIFVQDFDQALSAIFGQYSVCVHAPECGNNFAMEFNGDVYACDHWVEPDWLIGSVTTQGFPELAADPKMLAFGEKKRAQLTAQCRRCPYLRVCNGGCPKDRFVSSRDGEEGHNYLCPGYEMFYRHSGREFGAMARLLQWGRAPADICLPEVRERFGLTRKDSNG